MKKLRQVIYISQATRPLDAGEIHDLVRKAATNNKKLEITGALLFLEGSFVQVLEGDSEAIGELLGKLSRDSRHCNLRLLSDIQIDSRQFKHWSMGLVDTPESARPTLVREITSVSTLTGSCNNEDFDMPLPETFMMMQHLYTTDKALQRVRGRQASALQ